MICWRCSAKIELITKKDQDTGKWYNFWNCEDCGQTQPREATRFDMNEGVNFAPHKGVDRYVNEDEMSKMTKQIENMKDSLIKGLENASKVIE